MRINSAPQKRALHKLLLSQISILTTVVLFWAVVLANLGSREGGVEMPQRARVGRRHTRVLPKGREAARSRGQSNGRPKRTIAPVPRGSFIYATPDCRADQGALLHRTMCIEMHFLNVAFQKRI
jgi:hypothetical protein